MLTVMGPEALTSGLHSLLNHTTICVSNCTHGKSKHRDTSMFSHPFQFHQPLTNRQPKILWAISSSFSCDDRHAVKEKQPSTFGVLILQ